MVVLQARTKPILTEQIHYIDEKPNDLNMKYIN